MALIVAYPGPEGSHSDSAAAAMFAAAERFPVGSFRAVAEAVTTATAAHGVLPIESSLAGSVPETHDLLNEYPIWSRHYSGYLYGYGDASPASRPTLQPERKAT